MPELPPVPTAVRIRLAHATLQAVADECGADVLHLKGAALDATLQAARARTTHDGDVDSPVRPRPSGDADVLVRPEHLERFQRGLQRHGWQPKTRLTSGGVIEHAVDYWHPQLGKADVHVRFPGIGLAPEPAFERLWGDRKPQAIAHRTCAVPSGDAQRLVLLLHAARNGGATSADVPLAWTDTTEEAQGRIVRLATDLGAEVALAAATGQLSRYADRREHDLWRLMSSGNTGGFDLWLARVKAASTPAARLRTVLDPLHPHTDDIAVMQQRAPTIGEVAGRYARKAGGLVRGTLLLAHSRVGTRRNSGRKADA